METINSKSTEEIISEIDNVTKKKKKKNNKKKNKKQNNNTKSEATTETGSIIAENIRLKAVESKLPTNAKVWDSEIKKEVITQIVEDEKKEQGVTTRSKTANQNQKNKGKQQQKVGGALPKVVKEKECILPKIELSDSFWEVYKSDYFDSDSDAESLDEYAKDGYHPVHVGETLNERYRIMKKLGWGAFSTVWF